MQRGFDVWVVELRGAGQSSRPTLWNSLRYDWYFDHYVRFDIPAALDLVRGLTGYEEVHWIGHSMGGMVAYAYCIEQNRSQIRSIIAIGSPSFAKLENALFNRLVTLKPLLKFLPKLPYEGTGLFVVPLMPIFRETLGRLLANPRNMRNRDLIALVTLVPADLPTSLVSQFAGWYESGGFRAALQHVDYGRGLETITNPTLIVAGAADLLTPVSEMEFVFDSLGGTEKEFLLLGRSTGCRHDYGHIDPVLGRYAETEVWPHFDAFIRKHTSI